MANNAVGNLKKSILSITSRGLALFVYLIILSLLAMMGCYSPPAGIEAGLGEEFRLSIEQVASLEEGNLEIQFIGIVSDSRCPTGATCIWQGEVTAVIDINYGGSVHRKSLIEPGLTTTPSQSEFQEYRFTYSVEPYPVLGKDIKDSEYRLKMRVEKK